MFKRQPVLVAIDRATDVERTVGAAVATAKARGAHVRVIRVVPHSAWRADDRLEPWGLEPRADRDVGSRARLASVARAAQAERVRVRSVTLRGIPERVIPAYAHLHQAALVVAERQYGKSFLSRSGRAVDALARRSPIPLLVLPRNRKREREGRRLRRILAPIDFSTASAIALRSAVDLSRRHGAGGRVRLSSSSVS